jgi:hypothetical protein
MADAPDYTPELLARQPNPAMRRLSRDGAKRSQPPGRLSFESAHIEFRPSTTRWERVSVPETRQSSARTRSALPSRRLSASLIVSSIWKYVGASAFKDALCVPEPCSQTEGERS